MTRMRRMLVPLAAAVALATPAAAATAPPATAAPPRAATAFVAAFDAAIARAKAYTAVHQQRLTVIADRCNADMRAAPEAAAPLAAGLVMATFIAEGVQRPAPEVFGKLVADLEAIPTRDRALRRARAVWRTYVRDLVKPPERPDACDELARWRAAGWAESVRPPGSPDDFVGDVVPSDAESDRMLAKLGAAMRRLRALGIDRRAAQRLDGEAVFAALPAMGSMEPR